MIQISLLFPFVQAEMIHALGEQIGTLMAKAEENGAAGEVEESMKMLEEVEALKAKKTAAEVWHAMLCKLLNCLLGEPPNFAAVVPQGGQRKAALKGHK